MHSFVEAKEHFLKYERKIGYEKKNYNGIALCCITAHTVG